MKTKLAILVWSLSPERPELAAAPFVYAATAEDMHRRELLSILFVPVSARASLLKT